MIVFWVTLLLLHQGYTLTPVTTVHLGEAATFTCALHNKDQGNRKLQWYKQSAGETLKLIVTLIQTTNLEYAPEFSESRLVMNYDDKFSNLTIMRTIQEDEGMYHCAISEWINVQWSGTYLLVKGNPQRTSNYSVVQWPTESDPDGLRTLQCSVLSDSENKTCSGDHRVFWFRSGSDKSHPDIIYTDRNRHDGCNKRSDIQKRSCVYNFSKSVSSSDDGTYYCAVATCGEILFGDGSKVDIEGTSICSDVISLLCAVSAINLIVIAVLIYAIMKNKSGCDNAAVAVQRSRGDQRSQQKHEHTEVYSAVVFTVMGTGCGAKAAERQRIYAAVKAFGSD